jgi:hypothetical protein
VIAKESSKVIAKESSQDRSTQGTEKERNRAKREGGETEAGGGGN